MSCGVPCVSTDVGDAAEIIGATGRTVAAQSPQLFADALLELLNLPAGNRRQLGSAARQRVIDNFELTHATEMFLSLWRELAGVRNVESSKQRAA